MAPFKGLQPALMRCFRTSIEIQSHCTAGKGHRKLSRTTDANIDCVFVKKRLVFLAPKFSGDRDPLAPAGQINTPNIEEIDLVFHGTWKLKVGWLRWDGAPS